MNGVLTPYEVVVPYSKCQVVTSPLGFTVPFSVAELGVTSVGGFVRTIGLMLKLNEAILVLCWLAGPIYWDVNQKVLSSLGSTDISA